MHGGIKQHPEELLLSLVIKQQHSKWQTNKKLKYF